MTLLTTDISKATANDLLDRIDIMAPIVESRDNRGMPSISIDLKPAFVSIVFNSSSGAAPPVRVGAANRACLSSTPRPRQQLS